MNLRTITLLLLCLSLLVSLSLNAIADSRDELDYEDFEECVVNCTVEKKEEPTEPKNPYKTNSYAGYWDQGNSQSCFFTAIMNMNIMIDMSSDQNKWLFNKFMKCLQKKYKTVPGLRNFWRRGVPAKIKDPTGKWINTPEMNAILECKKEVMDQHRPQWYSVTTSTLFPQKYIYTATDPFSGASAEGQPKKPCQEIKDRGLHGAGIYGGSVVMIHTQRNTAGSSHAAVVRDIKCSPPDAKNQLTLQDPNDPNETPIVLTVDDKGKTTECTPVGHPRCQSYINSSNPTVNSYIIGFMLEEKNYK